MDKQVAREAAKRWAVNSNCSVIGKVWMPDDEGDVENFADWFVNVLDGVLDEMKRGNPRKIKRDESCFKCDTDTHVCPGCGEPLKHGIYACPSCLDEV